MPKTGVFSAIFVHFAQKTINIVLKVKKQSRLKTGLFVQFAQNPVPRPYAK